MQTSLHTCPLAGVCSAGVGYFSLHFSSLSRSPHTRLQCLFGAVSRSRCGHCCSVPTCHPRTSHFKDWFVLSPSFGALGETYACGKRMQVLGKNRLWSVWWHGLCDRGRRETLLPRDVISGQPTSHSRLERRCSLGSASVHAPRSVTAEPYFYLLQYEASEATLYSNSRSAALCQSLCE